MKTEQIILVTIVFVALIAAISMIAAFQQGEKTGSIIYHKRTAIQGYQQRGETIRERSDYLDSQPESEGRKTRESYPRLLYSQAGTYQEGLTGNYKRARFGTKGFVPTKTTYGYSAYE